jgi:hypothetical protein
MKVKRKRGYKDIETVCTTKNVLKSVKDRILYSVKFINEKGQREEKG